MADSGHNGRLAGPVLCCNPPARGCSFDARESRTSSCTGGREGVPKLFPGGSNPYSAPIGMVTAPGSYIYSVAGITAANWATGPPPGAPRPCFLAYGRSGAPFAGPFGRTCLNRSTALGASSSADGTQLATLANAAAHGAAAASRQSNLADRLA